MNKIHLSTAKKMLMAPDPVDLTVVTKSGEVITLHNAVGLKANHYAGTRNVKCLDNGEIRSVRDSLIVAINGIEVFM